MFSKLLHVTIAVAFGQFLTFGTLASPLKREVEIEAREGGEVSLTKRFTGTKWTFYDVQTGNEVYCGGFHYNGEAIVALSGENMNRDLCGKSIRMTYNGVTKYATIVDMCPSCPSEGLDLAQGFFPNFAPASVGIIYGDWEYADAAVPATTPTSTYTPPQATTPTYTTTYTMPTSDTRPTSTTPTYVPPQSTVSETSTSYRPPSFIQPSSYSDTSSYTLPSTNSEPPAYTESNPPPTTTPCPSKLYDGEPKPHEEPSTVPTLPLSSETPPYTVPSPPPATTPCPSKPHDGEPSTVPTLPLSSSTSLLSSTEAPSDYGVTPTPLVTPSSTEGLPTSPTLATTSTNPPLAALGSIKTGSATPAFAGVKGICLMIGSILLTLPLL